MVMHVDNHNPQFSCTIDGQILDEVTEHKGFGVVFDNAWKFHSCVCNSFEGKEDFGHD